MTGAQVVARRRLAAAAGALVIAGVVAALVAGGGGPQRPTRASQKSAKPASSRRARASGASTPPIPLPSLRRQIGQRLMVAFDGTEAPADLIARTRAGEVGGIILFAPNIVSASQVRRLTRSLQRAAREGGNPPLLVATDQEGGSVRRFSAAPPGFAPPDMSASGRPAVAYSEGLTTGRFLRRVGVNLDLAPVADVAGAGSFIAAEARSFGSDPQTVATYAGAFLRGLHAGGVMGTGKHFPGVGAATVDTDYELDRLPLANASLTEALIPYRQLIADRVDAVMLATAAYPRLDPSGRPAALSARIQSLLRRTLGFTGLTITDALESPTGLGADATALAAARSGADILLYTGDGEGAFETLLQAARSGGLPLGAVAAAYRHVAGIKRRLSWTGSVVAPSP